MEFLNKAKTFIKKHKRGLFYTTCIVGGAFLGIKIRQDKLNFGKECFMAGSRLSTIADVTAMEKVLDSNKTKEIMAESANITKTMCDTLAKYNIKPETFNQMYESGVIPKAWSSNN